MSEKRRDSKGRILRDGELQRADGMYMYRYTDVRGVRRCLYSWRLVKTDRLPDGKRACEPLRETIAKVAQDIKDGIDGYRARSTTLNSFYDEYISMKYELKDSTLNSYKYFWRKFIKDAIGHMEVGAIKFSDIKKFCISLIRVNGFKPNSVENIQTILHPVFAAAVRDGYIRTNPTEGVLKEIKKSHNWEKPKRHALTEAQQRRFISYVAKSKTYSHWLPLFTVLLGTGGRISEILGLRWEDCDFDHCLISINHNLIYRQMDDGKMAYQITTPKTESGKRIVPMFSEVKAILQSLPRDACTSTVDGCSGFIFANRYGEILNPHAVNRAIDRIIRDANLEEGEHETLPHFSVHNLRHTFCTRMCENEPNIKIIQEIMGHRDIQTTMDVYNEATKEKKIESFARLEGKMSIAVT